MRLLEKGQLLISRSLFRAAQQAFSAFHPERDRKRDRKETNDTEHM